MKYLTIQPDLYEFIKNMIDDRIKEIKVSREQFDRLSQKVENLTDAVYNLTERIDSLAESVLELTEAQKRTDIEIKEMRQSIRELTEAQKRTDEKMTELIEAQKRTDEKIAELTEAQKRTDIEIKELRESIKELAKMHKETDKHVSELERTVGKLANDYGLTLEDIGRVVIPGWIERHLHVFVDELERKFFTIDDKEVEINFYGEGLDDDGEVIIIGESKTRIYGKDVKQFIGNYSKIKDLFDKKVIMFMFGYVIHPSAEEVAKKHNIHLIASYQR